MPIALARAVVLRVHVGERGRAGADRRCVAGRDEHERGAGRGVLDGDRGAGHDERAARIVGCGGLRDGRGGVVGSLAGLLAARSDGNADQEAENSLIIARGYISSSGVSGAARDRPNR